LLFERTEAVCGKRQIVLEAWSSLFTDRTEDLIVISELLF